MAACSLSVSEAHRIRLGALVRLCRSGGYAAASAVRFPAAGRPGRRQDELGLFIKELTRGDFDRCLVVSPGSLAARFEGRFRHGVHQVEVSDPMRRLVKEIRSNSTRRRCFLGARLYRSVQALARRLAPPQRGYGFCAHRIFKSWTIWTRSWRSSRGSPSTPSAWTLITAWIDDRRSRGRPPGAPENHVARGT